MQLHTVDNPSDRIKTPFTLIELLVVVAIIAILASMLLPALSVARETGRNAVCVSNLKQIGMAQQLYADDGDDFPAAGINPQGDTTGMAASYFQRLRDGKYVPNAWPQKQVPKHAGGTKSTGADGTNYGFYGVPPVTSTIFACPSAAAPSTASTIGDSIRYRHVLTNYDIHSVDYYNNIWVTMDEPGFQGHYAAGRQPWGRFTFNSMSPEADLVALNYCGPGTREDPRGFPNQTSSFYRSDQLNFRHRNHHNLVHWDLHVSAYTEAAYGVSSGYYPWFARRRGNTQGLAEPQPSYDKSIAMTQLK